ncbi:hypothetical protein TNCV_4951651 [Trichonephila clavipes]|nr:hypothetical protein TNCV_4951651 [Trichonephila clavipes]
MRYVHGILQPLMLPLMQQLPRVFFLVFERAVSFSHLFSTRQCSASHGKGVTRLSPHCSRPVRAYLGSFETASGAFHEFE